jgi:glycine cleavage system H protein
MIPTVYEWHWDMGHFIFMGLFYAVLVAIASTLTVALLRSLKSRSKAVEIIWEEVFHDLPKSRKRCRYEISGRANDKVCDHEFDCGACSFHALRKTTPDPEEVESKISTGDLGFDVNPNLKYHRGHTWVREEDDGTFSLGLDDFAKRVVGRPDEVVLPEVGTKLAVNETGFEIRKRGTDITVLSPVEGEVTELGSHEKGWWLKVKPTGGPEKLEQLFQGDMALKWSAEELEMLKRRLGADKNPFLGNPDGPASAYPKADWETIWHDVFLNV